jgi:hypothetical protein
VHRLSPASPVYNVPYLDTDAMRIPNTDVRKLCWIVTREGAFRILELVQQREVGHHGPEAEDVPTWERGRAARGVKENKNPATIVIHSECLKKERKTLIIRTP